MIGDKLHKKVHIRSFATRLGRITPSQKRGFDTLWHKYGIIYDTKLLNFTKVFANDNSVCLEIGFGMGDSLWEMVVQNPHINFIGVEVHKPGAGALINKLQESDCNNAKLICHDVVEVLTHQIPDSSLDKIQIFFPDPWPKKRHHKRRLIQPQFIELINKKLKNNAIVHIATDWTPYASYIKNVFNDYEEFLVVNAIELENQKLPFKRPLTKFEQKGLNKGHTITDLIYMKGF